MKTLILILFLLPLSLLAKPRPNAIDSIKTDSDVVRFLNTYLKDNDYMDFTDFSFEKRAIFSNLDFAARLYVKTNWIKADFDNNGRTDLLLYDFGRSCFYIVMSEPDNKFKLIRRGRPSAPVFPQLIKYHGQDMLRVYHYDLARPQRTTLDTVDTVVYKFKGLVNLNQKPNNRYLDSFVYQHHNGWNLRADDKMIISKSGIVKYYESYEMGKDTFFIKRANKKNLYDIFGLIDYIDFDRMSSKYRVNSPDQSSVIMVFYFRNRSPITIQDIGMEGSFSLNTLYRLLKELPENQGWIKKRWRY